MTAAKKTPDEDALKHLMMALAESVDLEKWEMALSRSTKLTNILKCFNDLTLTD